MSAPLTGGYQPGADRFAVDGNFSFCDPCSLPEISYPFQGDSIFSQRDTLFFNGTFYEPLASTLPWSANQVAIVLMQDFMVAQSYYEPMRLNTPYNPAWATGWQGQFPDGVATVPLNNLYLVREGDLLDMGGGICKIRRTWASIPPTRNEAEQFSYQFPGFNDDVSGINRNPFTRTVLSRLQYEYVIFDDLGILSIPVWPNGSRLDASTGLYPSGLIIDSQFYYSDDPSAITSLIYVDSLHNDSTGGSGPGATVPAMGVYQKFATGESTSNNLPGEIVAESSTMSRWMGNIFEVRTRFVIAQ